MLVVVSEAGLGDKRENRIKRLVRGILVDCGVGGWKVEFIFNTSISVREDVLSREGLVGVVMMGDEAIKCMFPNAESAVYSSALMRGSLVPLKTNDGKFINGCVVYGPKRLLSGFDDSVKQVLSDDIYGLVSYKKTDFDFGFEPEIILCKEWENLVECSDKLKSESVVVFDFETEGLKPFNKDGKEFNLYSVSFAFEDGKVYAIPLSKEHLPPVVRDSVFEMVREFFYTLNPEQIKIGHNVKFDLMWGLLKAGEGLDRFPCGKYEDTSLLCWMKDERKRMSGLKVAAWRYLGVSKWSVDVKNVRKIPISELLRYNALDAFYTLRLWKRLNLVILSEIDKRLYYEILMPTMIHFMRLEMRGVPIDMGKLEKFTIEFDKRKEVLLREIREEAGRELATGSTKELQKYFIDECGYKLPRKTKTGYSVDEGAIIYLVDTYGDKVAEKLLELRGVEKMLSTYLRGLGKHIFDDGRLHGGYNLTATVTGRTSSSDPNMQNFPKRKGKYIREIVKAPEGYKLCSFDYGQIEARLFAVVTADKKYIKDLYEGYDIHLEQAIDLYHRKLGMTKEEAAARRYKMKNGGVFPIFYGAGTNTVARGLEVDEKLAYAVKTNLFKRYPGIRLWQKEIVDEEAENGVIDSLFGKQRRSPMSYTELLNFINQSSASDITLSAMNYLAYKYELAFMVHDDISFFIKDDDSLSENLFYIAEAMLVVPWTFLKYSDRLREYVPLSVECEVGDNWGEQEEIFELDSVAAGFDTLEKCLERGEEIKKELLEYRI